MSLEMIVGIVFASVVLIGVVTIVLAKRPKKLKQPKFKDDWKAVQKLCADKAAWPDAIILADRLLDKALRKRKYKGKSTGERLVSAQKAFKSNDDVWFAHNLYKKIIAEPELNLKQDDVKDALSCFRQALRDLGALESPSDQSSEAKQ